MIRSRLIEWHRLKHTTREKSFVYGVSVTSASNRTNGVLRVFSVGQDSVRLHVTESGQHWFPEGPKWQFRSEVAGQGWCVAIQRPLPASRPTILAMWFASLRPQTGRFQLRVLHLPASLRNGDQGQGTSCLPAELGLFH